MKRVIIKLGGYLLLGAVVNVAVAWGCVFWTAPLFDWSSSSAGDDHRWHDQVPNDWPEQSTFGINSQSVGLSLIARSHVAFDRDAPSHSLNIYDAGVPYRTLRRIELLRTEAGLESEVAAPWGVWHKGVDAPPLIRRWSNVSNPRLPLIPIWPGFAINTFFYAAILWLLFAVPGRVRRWRRIRRGLCVKCAYPVGTSEVCTECGASVSKKIKARGSRGRDL